MDASADTQANGITNVACGSLTGDGTIALVTLGFEPRHVRVFNETDVIMWEKFAGQADATSVKTVTAGTTTADATSAIIIRGGDADGDTYRGFELSAAVAASAKVLRWIAFG